MALIPGTLPSDTCYGTPQDLLELFAQYLDIPAVALQSKVFFGTSSTGLTSDSIWIDTTSATNPIFKLNIGGTWTDYVKNYVDQRATATIASGDYLLISDVSDSNNTKKGLVSDIVTMAAPAAGSITYSMLSTSATDSVNVSKRTAKAWVSNVAALTAASFNVSSVAYSTPAFGYVRITFTANIGTSYVAVANVGNRSTNPATVDGSACHAVTYNTAYVDFVNKSQGYSVASWTNIDAIVIGN